MELSIIGAFIERIFYKRTKNIKNVKKRTIKYSKNAQ